MYGLAQLIYDHLVNGDFANWFHGVLHKFR
jgi:hypothetical protein